MKPDDKVMVLLDSHHSEYHVMVSIKRFSHPLRLFPDDDPFDGHEQLALPFKSAAVYGSMMSGGDGALLPTGHPGVLLHR